jgi:hypothetical protein
MIHDRFFCALAAVILAISLGASADAAPRRSARESSAMRAVKVAAKRDCGCGACAAKGCQPCHGKNCYYCVAKALVTTECGCKGCTPTGCKSCGPGCDVCKFHLAPAKTGTIPQPPKK